MGCDKCDEYEEFGKIAYYRWGTANIGLVGCPDHIKEVIEFLNSKDELINKEKFKRDFAEMLGHWYFEWKGKITDPRNTHSLGFAKEDLKRKLEELLENGD